MCVSLMSGSAFAQPPAFADDITPCVSCDERYDGPRLCAECRERYARIEAREYPDRTAEDAAWLDMVDEVLERVARAARRPS